MINESKNFNYLKKLIESNDHISLERDIILSDFEVECYSEGIEIAKDTITIEGCNHVIDARGMSCIFNISSKNMTLKNIIFKNGYSSDVGGAIIHNKGNLKIINCQFINNTSEKMGGAISCSFGSDMTIINTKFLKNHSSKGGCIFNKNGKIKLIKCGFIKNTAKIDASTIINMMMGILTVQNCIFEKNTAKNAGSILNFGKCDIEDSSFEKNCVEENGGAINNQIRSRLSVKESKFIDNKSGNEGGAIANFSDAKLNNVTFLKNHSRNQAGAISNQKDGTITIKSSKFIQNNSDMTSGAILNWGKISIEDSKFKDNSSNEFGGAILNGEIGFLKIKTTEFKNNSCNYSGGAIVNWRKINLSESLFENNSAGIGGAIICAKKAHTTIDSTKFICNSSQDSAAIANNSHNTKISRTLFANHIADNVIHNYKSLSLLDVNFENNKANNILINDTNGQLSMFNGRFKNVSAETSIYNIGDFCSLAKIKFESKEKITEIHNKSYMSINELKFTSNYKTLINEGILDIKNMSDDLISKNIKNLNKINNFSKRSKNKYDFSFLQDKINKKTKFKKPNLKLKNDISLEFYECDFFEGGIEITADNLTIDGENHTIDAKGRTRIFIINAKNVTLKNLTLTNGQYRNDFDKYVLGGGAIHILKDSSLRIKNVTFKENKSNTCGGAILNEGNVKSINSKFINNTSNNYGGAIYNKNRFNTDNDEFKDNAAKIAGAIYNQKHLKIGNDIIFDNNRSQFIQEIYNAGITEAKEKFKDLIFNTAKINEKKTKSKSFSYLEEEIERSDEIILNQDILFNYHEDKYLKYIIQISKDLTIDGNGHSIEFNPLDGKYLSVDGNNSSSLFKIIKESTNVTLKNIIFKNCYSNRQSIIENKGNLTIENCKFINNRITEDNSLIENKHRLKIINSDFANNKSYRESLIINSSELNIINSNFINNNSQAIGCCINNNREMTIEKSIFKSNTTKNKAGAIHNEYESSLKVIDVKFKYNSADVDGGAIYNYGKLDIEDSIFANNTSEDNGGAINNRTSGEINIIGTKFIENESKSNGGAIYNYGNVEINLCEFKNNSAKYRASVIEHAKTLDNRKRNNLTISDSKFVKNISNYGKEIVAFDKTTLKLMNCKFNQH